MNNKDKILKEYKRLFNLKSLKDLNNNEALFEVGKLIDFSMELKEIKGLNKSIELLEEIKGRKFEEKQETIYYYFNGNAWSNKRKLSRRDVDKAWEWEQDEAEKEMLNYRKSLQSKGFKNVSKEYQCSILTNLGNLLSAVGRFVEAVDYWDKALQINSSFAMAIGCRGYGLSKYSQCLYDSGHRRIFMKFAYNALRKSLSYNLHSSAKKDFRKKLENIKSILKPEFIDKEINLEDFPLGESKEEIKYRKWCLDNKVFLNPMNDLGSNSIAAQDILTTPPMIMAIGEGPHYPGFYNQMKQEFVSARYLYYDGINTNRPHFSDKETYMYNSLDYPVYSINIEKVKMSYRMLYSLFDKIAFFMNHYLQLKINIKEIYFKTIWYKSQKRNKGLKDCFKKMRNFPLRGLFWMSKDLFEEKPGFRDYIEPEAKNLYEIRNYLEHQYLKIHGSDWSGVKESNNVLGGAFSDTLASSFYREVFEAKTLKLMKLIRAALIYLLLSIYIEEIEKRKKIKDKNNKIIPGMKLDIYEDEWKV